MVQLRTALLADHPGVLPQLERWFRDEWPGWYGPGGSGNAREDLSRCAQRSALPIGVVGFLGDELVGIMVLKAQSVSGRPDLTPWAAAGLVLSTHRRRGFGAQLLCALEEVARCQGFTRVYCGTATSVSLLERSGWSFVEHSDAHGEAVAIYEKRLPAPEMA